MDTLELQLNENLYLRDPQATNLGRRIISAGIRLMGELGFEEFTFRKLAMEIGSTEASVYRYFQNKHKFLIYLIDWYWTCLEYRIDCHVKNITDPVVRLKVCMTKIAEQKSDDPDNSPIDERALERIVIGEFEKTFLTKQVDADNEEGLFLPYKSLCNKVASIIKEVNPAYEFPHSLASSILLLVKHQLYYASHLPGLSDIKNDPKRQHRKLYTFLETLVFKTIEK